MATPTYAALQAKLAKLHKEAEAVRDEEVAGVIVKIKEAISVYGLEPSDLFTKPIALINRPSARSPDAKYSDGQGGEWSGRGPRPLWLREALSNGHALEEFAVNLPPLPATSKFSTRRTVNSPKKAPKRTPLQYRDPNTGKQWSGFGRQPDWLRKAIAAGHTLESLQV